MTLPLLTLFIPELPKLPNRLLGSHWRTRSGHAKKWARLVSVHLTGQLNRQFPLSKARIKFTRCSIRQSDFDGLVGSMKAPMDALVKCGVLVDDSPKYVMGEYMWEKVKRLEQGVRIEVWGDDGDRTP